MATGSPHPRRRPPRPARGNEDPAALRAYLLAADHSTLATANLDGPSDWIGAATPKGAALLDLNRLTARAVGTADAAHELQQWISQWRAGRPDLDRLQPVLSRTQGGWHASLAIR